MNDLLQAGVYYLIAFFASLLVYFLAVLLIVHLKTSSTEKRKTVLRKSYDDVVAVYETTGRNHFDKYRKFRTHLGVMVLDELLQDAATPHTQIIKTLIADSTYDKYVLKLFRSRDALTKIFAVKMIADLSFAQCNDLLLKMVLQESDNADLQYHAIMALSRLGDERALIKIFCEEKFSQKLTFRSLQEILKAYAGDKGRLYWILLEAPDPYIRRICIKRIGTEGIQRLSGFLIPYLSNEDYNIALDAVRSLGQLKYGDALPKIEELTAHPRWEVRAACINALAQIDLQSEIGFITSGLFDKEWWVRRNAAAAAVNYEPLRDIVKYIVDSDDRFAKEILAAAIKKKELLERGGLI